MFLVRVDLNRFLRLDDPVSVAVSHVVRCPEVAIRVYVTVATVRHAVRSSVLVVELAIRANVVAETVGI